MYPKSHTAPSAPYTRPTQWLSRPPPIQKLGAENHMLQLNSWWWAYVSETCRAKNISITLPSCMKLSFHFISWGRCTVKQPLRPYMFLGAFKNHCERLLLASSCWAVCPPGITLFPLGGYWWNLFYHILLKSLNHIKSEMSLHTKTYRNMLVSCWLTDTWNYLCEVINQKQAETGRQKEYELRRHINTVRMRVIREKSPL